MPCWENGRASGRAGERAERAATAAAAADAFAHGRLRDPRDGAPIDFVSKLADPALYYPAATTDVPAGSTAWNGPVLQAWDGKEYVSRPGVMLFGPVPVPVDYGEMWHELKSGVGNLWASMFGDYQDTPLGPRKFNPWTGEDVSPRAVQDNLLLTLTSFTPAGPARAVGTRVGSGLVDDVGRLVLDGSLSQAPIWARVEAHLAESAAARSGSAFTESTVAQLQRRQIATDFYSARGYSGASLESHLSGIDFTRPVNPVLLRQGAQVDQWVGPHGVGSYFTPVGTPANQLGILPDNRTLSTFRVQQNTWGLRSTAADFNWPGGFAPGGGTQYFVSKPDRGFFVPTNR